MGISSRRIENVRGGSTAFSTYHDSAQPDQHRKQCRDEKGRPDETKSRAGRLVTRFAGRLGLFRGIFLAILEKLGVVRFAGDRMWVLINCTRPNYFAYNELACCGRLNPATDIQAALGVQDLAGIVRQAAGLERIASSRMASSRAFVATELGAGVGRIRATGYVRANTCC